MLKTYFDRIDEHDHLIGGTATYDEVHGNGLWHRGVHVILHTADGEILMQKRSPSLKYHPDEIEVSVGGGVNAGESPETAMIREIQEELGISIQEHQLRFLGKTKLNHRTRTQSNRVFIYSYAALVSKSAIDLSIHNEEISAVFWITKQRLSAALRVHRIKNIGKISSLYAYWRSLLEAI